MPWHRSYHPVSFVVSLVHQVRHHLNLCLYISSYSRRNKVIVIRPHSATYRSSQNSDPWRVFQATSTATWSTYLSATAPFSVVTRRWSRSPRRRTLTRMCGTRCWRTPYDSHRTWATRTRAPSSSCSTSPASTTSSKWTPDCKWNTQWARRSQGEFWCPYIPPLQGGWGRCKETELNWIIVL